MKRKYINIVVFFTLIMGIGLLNLFYSDRQVSVYENRELEQFPQFSIEKFLSGEYFERINLYFSDQFLLRDNFVQISSVVKDFKGIPGIEGATIVVQSGFNDAVEQAAVPYINENMEDIQTPDESHITITPEPSLEKALQENLVQDSDYDIPVQEEFPDATHEVEDSNADSSDAHSEDKKQTDLLSSSNEETQAIAEPTKVPSNAVTPDKQKDDNGKKIGRILIYKNSAMQLFRANGVAEEYYANTLNSFKQRVGEQIKVYSLLAPTSIEFIDNMKYKELTDSQKDAISRVNNKFEGIETVNAYEKLEEKKDEYIHFRTDHHWTALGAYYAYTGFASSAGFGTIPLEKYETEIIEEYVGSMYDMTSSNTLKKHPDTITVYKPFVENVYNVWYEGPVKLKVIDMYHASKKNKYRVFISGDRPLGIIESEVKNNKKILVIKDSYGNAMVPFLLPHYEEIYVVDPRQYKKNIFELIEDKGLQEVLFLNYALILGDTSFPDLIVKVMEQ